MQNKLYTTQFFLTAQWPICSQSLSSYQRTHGFHRTPKEVRTRGKKRVEPVE